MTRDDRMDVPDAVERIDGELRALGSAERAVQEKSYLKSDRVHYGVPVPQIRKVANVVKNWYEPLDHDALTTLAVALWDSDVYERKAVVVELLDLHGKLLAATDVDLIERLLRESRTWALVDHLAEKVAGGLVERHPGLAACLDAWATDDDFWIRRSALLALLGPLRRGGGDFDRFGRYADVMLGEQEFFIRKAIGWVLRDTGNGRPDLVFDWLLPRAGRASGVTLREAVKPLSVAQRGKITAMAARKLPD